MTSPCDQNNLPTLEILSFSLCSLKGANRSNFSNVSSESEWVSQNCLHFHITWIHPPVTLDTVMFMQSWQKKKTAFVSCKEADLNLECEGEVEYAQGIPCLSKFSYSGDFSVSALICQVLTCSRRRSFFKKVLQESTLYPFATSFTHNIDKPGEQEKKKKEEETGRNH